MGYSREDVVNAAKGVSSGSLDLAWVLAPVSKERQYKGWGFKSYAKWLQSDLCNRDEKDHFFLSKSYANQLTQVGIAFFDHSGEIDELVRDGKVAIRTLIDLASLIQQGMDIELALDHLRNGTPIPEEWTEQKSDPEKPTPVDAWVKGGDEPNFKLALTLYAILFNHKSQNEALNAMVLGSLGELLDMYKQKESLHKYEELIFNDRFVCKLCGDIPTDPTLHHIFPRSLGHGYGKLALLCWSSCHEAIVQPNWEKYCEEWWQHPDACRREVDAIIKEHGSIPNDVLTASNVVV